MTDTEDGANGTEEQGERALQAKQPLQVTREERLEAENLSLRLMNLSHEEAYLLEQLAKIRDQKRERQNALIAFRDQLAEKYSVDWTQFELQPDTGFITKKG